MLQASMIITFVMIEWKQNVNWERINSISSTADSRENLPEICKCFKSWQLQVTEVQHSSNNMNKFYPAAAIES